MSGQEREKKKVRKKKSSASVSSPAAAEAAPSSTTTNTTTTKRKKPSAATQLTKGKGDKLLLLLFSVEGTIPTGCAEFEAWLTSGVETAGLTLKSADEHVLEMVKMQRRVLGIEPHPALNPGVWRRQVHCDGAVGRLGRFVLCLL